MANRKDFNVVKGNAAGKQNAPQAPQAPQAPKKPLDPQMTIDVKNPELVALIAAYKEEKTPENLNKLMDLLRDARVLVPAVMKQIKDKMLPVPAIFANQNQDRFIWAFTDREQLPKDNNELKITGFVNMRFIDVVNLASVPEENLKGISVNPRTEGLVLTQVALKALQEGRRVTGPAPQPQPKPPVDPQMTIEVKNDELEAAIATYKAENSAKNLLDLLILTATARVLTPVVVKEVNGKNLPAPVLMNDNEGRKLIPVYTSKQYIPADLKMGLINLPFNEIAKVAAKEAEADEKFYGLVFDPKEFGIRFTPKLLQAIVAHPDSPEETMKEIMAIPQTKTVQMSEQQYMAFEHLQFENAFLPAELFTGGKEFIDRLCTEKEEYVDQLFEESYKEKRMYPYLPEDFSVMALGVEEGVEIVRVDFPSQDQGVGACCRAYLTWEESKKMARYFGIVLQANHKQTLVEITQNGLRKDSGACPTDGMELNKILELLHENA